MRLSRVEGEVIKCSSKKRKMVALVETLLNLNRMPRRIVDDARFEKVLSFLTSELQEEKDIVYMLTTTPPDLSSLLHVR